MRAKWKLTGSREGISEFRSRLLAREENAILFINIILIITLVIIVWEITKKFINQNSEEEVKNNSQRMLTRMIVPRKMCSQMLTRMIVPRMIPKSLSRSVLSLRHARTIILFVLSAIFV